MDDKRFTTNFNDLTDDGMENGRTWVYVCPDCNALFSSKAIPMRSIFPWFGYDPTDGNSCCITDGVRVEIERRAYDCECDARMERVMTVEKLKEAVNTYEGYSVCLP